MTEESGTPDPQGGVPLAAAITSLRAELMQAAWAGQFPFTVDGEKRWLRFKPSAVELTLHAAVTTTGTAKAGIKWWLVEAGGELGREKVSTQEVKLTLQPVFFDDNGEETEALIEGSNDPDDNRRARGEDRLDG